MSKCIVKSCQNHKHQGRFHGNLCLPCYENLKLVVDFKSKVNCNKEVLVDLFKDTDTLLKESVVYEKGEVVLCEVLGSGIDSRPSKEYLKKINNDYYSADGSKYGRGWTIKEI